MKINVNIKKQQNFVPVVNSTIYDLSNALGMVAEEIMTDAKVNYVPVGINTPAPGTLRRSGFVGIPVVTKQRVTVAIGFNTPYARKVHEAPPSWGQGKNKYLSKPINSAVPTLARRIRSKMRLSRDTP